MQASYDLGVFLDHLPPIPACSKFGVLCSLTSRNKGPLVLCIVLRDSQDPPGLASPPSLFVDKSRINSETLQYLNSSCTGPMCVQLENYNQVYDKVQAYASGAVRIWIGTSNTMYALYKVIPEVGLPGPSPGQALPHSSSDKSHLK